MSGKKQNGKQGKPVKSDSEAGVGTNCADKPNGNQSGGREFRPEWKPNVEFFTSLSKDGRFVICKTVITAIKPVGYFEKVLSGKDSAVGRENSSAAPHSSEKAG